MTEYKEIEPYELHGHNMRAYQDLESGKQLVEAADLYKALDYDSRNDLLEMLDDDEYDVDYTRFAEGVNGDGVLVSIEGMLSAQLCSTHPEARDFRRAFTHNLIPALASTDLELEEAVAIILHAAELKSFLKNSHENTECNTTEDKRVEREI
ncbi:BRO-N domain-containing protein [Devriesea agamarum]|uniref:BRO-N domain-containing protein n=1 Tax=Devriesea agamarum TaxID=472569 RepID=UPI00071CA479|nr:hypothetical protein [Devriesea agamarum]